MGPEFQECRPLSLTIEGNSLSSEMSVLGGPCRVSNLHCFFLLKLSGNGLRCNLLFGLIGNCEHLKGCEYKFRSVLLFVTHAQFVLLSLPQ